MRYAASPALLPVLLLVAAAPGQIRVSLRHGDQPSELQQRVLELGQEASRPAAMARLCAAGRPAVPLLLAAAQKEDALSLPALRVLAALGGLARPAQPALSRLGAGSSAMARAARETVAAIGERDSIVIADWSGNCIIELDRDGKERRRVAARSPWCVQPIADDHLLVCCHADKLVRELDWNGKEIRTWPCDGGPMQAVRLVDGSTVIAEQGPGKVQRYDADGKVVWTWKRSPRAIRVGLDDGLLLLEENGNLLALSPAGEVVREYRLDQQPMAFDLLPDGRIRVLYQNRLTEIGADGKQVEVDVARAVPGYALAMLRDGGCCLGENGKVTRRDRAGALAWSFPCQLCSRVVPRLELPDRD